MDEDIIYQETHYTRLPYEKIKRFYKHIKHIKPNISKPDKIVIGFDIVHKSLTSQKSGSPTSISGHDVCKNPKPK